MTADDLAWNAVIFPGEIDSNACHTDQRFNKTSAFFDAGFVGFQNQAEYDDGAIAVYECYDDFKGGKLDS